MPIYFTMRPLWFYFLPPGALFHNSACGIISQIGAFQSSDLYQMMYTNSRNSGIVIIDKRVETVTSLAAREEFLS